jgi:hypothetical protein
VGAWPGFMADMPRMREEHCNDFFKIIFVIFSKKLGSNIILSFL